MTSQMSLIHTNDHNVSMLSAAVAERHGEHSRRSVFSRIAERWEQYSAGERSTDLGSADLNRRLHRASF